MASAPDDGHVHDPTGAEITADDLGDDTSDGPRIAVLTAAFDARPGEEERLAAALARYVVLARGRAGCRNVDLLATATRDGRLLVVEKWDDADAARAHLDHDETVAMARDVTPLLASRPEIDLHDAVSAHDLL